MVTALPPGGSTTSPWIAAKPAISAEHPELTAELAAEWEENWSQR